MHNQISDIKGAGTSFPALWLVTDKTITGNDPASFHEMRPGVPATSGYIKCGPRTILQHGRSITIVIILTAQAQCKSASSAMTKSVPGAANRRIRDDDDSRFRWMIMMGNAQDQAPEMTGTSNSPASERQPRQRPG